MTVERVVNGRNCGYTVDPAPDRSVDGARHHVNVDDVWLEAVQDPVELHQSGHDGQQPAGFLVEFEVGDAMLLK